MFAAVFVCLLLLFALFILVAIVLVIKVAQYIFVSAVEEVRGSSDKVQEHKWRHASALERERMVRRACGWRVIGRIAGAGALITGAVVVTSPGLVFGSCLAAWRMLGPIKQEMRDACAYRSTGAKDEPRY
jgi:hypothetical protein